MTSAALAGFRSIPMEPGNLRMPQPTSRVEIAVTSEEAAEVPAHAGERADEGGSDVGVGVGGRLQVQISSTAEDLEGTSAVRNLTLCLAENCSVGKSEPVGRDANQQVRSRSVRSEERRVGK